MSLGGQLTGGNTQVQALHFDFNLNRNRKWIDEVTVKGSLDQSANAGTQTQFKAYAAVRYAHSLNKQYYQYYKLEADHDRFQDINIRLIPTVGVGYWFADEAEFKSMIEGAVGYQREFAMDQSVTESALLTVSSKLALGQLANDLNLYAAADDPSNFRLTNITKFGIKLNEHYAFKLMLKDEYNNRPAAGVEKNDVTFTTGLQYSLDETKPES
ncbi:DUF481 domain-containing protein [Candidatus Margulisiibacteriota bacterium]